MLVLSNMSPVPLPGREQWGFNRKGVVPHCIPSPPCPALSHGQPGHHPPPVLLGLCPAATGQGGHSQGQHPDWPQEGQLGEVTVPSCTG